MSLTMPPPTEEQLKEIIQGPSDVEWRYEMRRECQEILPNVLLGPFQASKSLETLQRLGITHIVCIRDAKEAFSVKPRFPDRFVYLTLDVQDNEEQNLISLFPKAKKFIDEALQNGGRTLVHCNGGISLSPAFVVMYVMQHYQMNWEDALHTVQNRRYCISPNGGFLTQIKEYESIYKANIAVMSNPSRIASPPTRRKREEESDDDEDLREESRKRAIRPLNGTTDMPMASPTSWTPSSNELERDPDAMET
ncbi:phosphatases II [Fomitiporia mediterranea MF3/22]|uniref:phosphatases II n=1 Tax=Fomitiporia mediterranea (strain MF3/22) TaxID=694068 RepID=UPI0004407B35|nr:phosphatases II [Fomitiporia mediterranea MF3/22]EJC97989.1 phosphatases II [Fomitiporia mediterranea MF3/22]